MYPIVRLAKEMFVYRAEPDLPVLGSHVSHHRCWPQDIDLYLEMNNGRILTILDLGRTGLAKRTGLIRALQRNRWGMTMAGASVRYRRRIRPFVRFKVASRCVGWDDKFFYLDQSIWIGDECAAHALFRSAVTDKSGIVKPGTLFRDINFEGERPTLPDWVQRWIEADADRPWPPELPNDISLR